MAYTKTEWVNDSEPAISAANLNKIEQGIADAHTAVEGKAAKSHKHALGDLNGASEVGKAVLAAEDAAAAREVLGAKDADYAPTWGEVKNKPSIPSEVPAGTREQLVAGTDETVRAFSAKDIHSFVDARINTLRPEEPSGE